MARAEIVTEVGTAIAAIEVPTTAASLRGDRANLYVIDHGIARRRRLALLGERAGSIFLDPSVPAGSHIVTEGRALLEDGDPVTERVEPFTPAGSSVAR